MAYLTIITGSFEFRDDFELFSKAFNTPVRYEYEIDGVIFSKTRFERVVITKEKEVIFLPHIIANLGYGAYSCTQTMGSGKTILGVEHLARIHANGGNTAANLSLAWTDNNDGMVKEEWKPIINSLDDFEHSNKATILFDDIKHTISHWNAEESDFISAVVNQSRKARLDILITTQRVINFVPPNIREVATNYEIPYVTIRDQRQESPDEMGQPLEMEILNISANGVFVGFGLFNGLICDGSTLMPSKKLLGAYGTMDIAVDLKNGEGVAMKGKNQPITLNKTEPYQGYDNERVVVSLLEKYVGELRHLAGEDSHKHLSDIEFNTDSGRYLIDTVGVGGKKGRFTLNTNHKHIVESVERIKKIGGIPLYAYTHAEKTYFVRGEDLIGKRGNISLSVELKARSHSAEFFFTRRDFGQ